MKRAELVEKAAKVLAEIPPSLRSGPYADAAAVVDVLLPQVTTVEELEALPNGTVLVGESGFPYWLTAGDDLTARTLLLHNGPLTVVYVP